MNTDSMTILHHSSPWEWALAQGSATRLEASPLARWLTVSAGRVWLTQSGAGPDAGDVWLAAGERHALPAGTEWVAEGWPAARVTLMEAPVTAQRAARAAWPLKALGVHVGAHRAHQPAVRPSPCAA